MERRETSPAAAPRPASERERTLREVLEADRAERHAPGGGRVTVTARVLAPRRPAATSRRAPWEGTVVRELALIALAASAYVGIRAVTEGRTDVAERNAHELVRLQEWLGVAWEAWAQSLVLGRDWLVALCNWVYIYGHWPVIATVAVVLYVTRRDRYRLLRNAVFVSGAIGFLFFALLPVAPPRLLELGLVDTVAQQSAAYRTLQPPELTNQYAALPSLHFGWNLLVGIVVFGTTRRIVLRAFAVVTPAAMAFAVVATANHFVLDVVLGLAVVLVGLAAAVRLDRRDGSTRRWRSAGATAGATSRG